MFKLFQKLIDRSICIYPCFFCITLPTLISNLLLLQQTTKIHFLNAPQIHSLPRPRTFSLKSKLYHRCSNSYIYNDGHSSRYLRIWEMEAENKVQYLYVNIPSDPYDLLCNFLYNRRRQSYINKIIYFMDNYSNNNNNCYSIPFILYSSNNIMVIKKNKRNRLYVNLELKI
jgi:hypothetical protein